MILELNDKTSWIEQIKLDKELWVDQDLFEELFALHPKERGEGVIFGQHVEFPRWQVSYGEDYYFTGQIHIGQPLTHPYLIKLLKYVQEHSKKPYKQVLVNWYQDGNDYIGPHSDDERQLVRGSAIYSFSFGQERDFVVKAKESKERHVIPMPNNSLIIMSGDIQRNYKHSVPKRAIKVCPGRRINITFRLFKGDNNSTNPY